MNDVVKFNVKSNEALTESIVIQGEVVVIWSWFKNVAVGCQWGCEERVTDSILEWICKKVDREGKKRV